MIIVAAYNNRHKGTAPILTSTVMKPWKMSMILSNTSIFEHDENEPLPPTCYDRRASADLGSAYILLALRNEIVSPSLSTSSKSLCID